MMLSSVVVGLVQAAWTTWPRAPSVGDSVQLYRWFRVPAEVRARVQPLAGGGVFEPLADPTISRDTLGLVVRYVVAMFEPGRQPVVIPPIELLRPNGATELVPSDTAWVNVAPVVTERDPSRRTPKPSEPPIARLPRRAEPLVIFTLLSVAITVGWAVLRRRGRSPPPLDPNGGRGAATDPPVARWLAAGEPKAAAQVAAERLRRRIAELEPDAALGLTPEQCAAIVSARRPSWPLGEVAAVLQELENARFTRASPLDVAALVVRAERLRASLD